MGYRTILIDLAADRPVEPRIQVGQDLSRRFGAALIGVHAAPRPLIPTLWEGGGAVYMGAEFNELQRKANETARRRVRAAWDQVGRPPGEATWHEAEGEPGEILARAAHCADLVVTAKGPPEAPDPYSLPEHLSMAAGVPVLVLPPAGARELGRTVLVAWNGSREATRAAHAALPFLADAGRVILCAVGGEAAADLQAAAAMLGRHGVTASCSTREGSGRDAGEILLEQAEAQDVDLIVMGAYGHARLREMVFGGATRHILRHAARPVLFSG